MHSTGYIPEIGGKALCVLVLFATTYLCESGLSSLLSIMTKSRNGFNLQVDLQIAFNKKFPGFNKILNKKLKSH